MENLNDEKENLNIADESLINLYDLKFSILMNKDKQFLVEEIIRKNKIIDMKMDYIGFIESYNEELRNENDNLNKKINDLNIEINKLARFR